MPSPAVTVHSLDHARAAARAAAGLGRALILLSAPGAAAYVGPAWFANVIAAATREVPDLDVRAYLDCDARAGDALAAFRAGVPGVIFTGRDDVFDKLAALADAQGIAFRRTRPAALDLLDRPDPEAAVRAHLAAG